MMENTNSGTDEIKVDSKANEVKENNEIKDIKEIGKNHKELTLLIEKPVFDEAVMKAYKRNAAKINVPGFRRGKAPKSIIEKMYGSSFFHDEAIDGLLPDVYGRAVESAGLEVVSRPDIEIVSINEEGVTLTAKVFIKPEAVVGKYKGLKANKEVVSVTNEEIDNEIMSYRKRNARLLVIEGEASRGGDTAVIDFEGFIDGVPFEGGKGGDHALKLGSGSFIPGFEDQVIGRLAGESFEVNVTFPADYPVSELAGKPAVFKVELKEIKREEIPVLDDEFVKEVSESLNTVDEYKADIKAKITDRKQKAEDRAYEEKIIDELLANTELDLPDAMIETEIDGDLRDFEYRLTSQGGSLDMYYNYTGMDEKRFRDSLRPESERRVRTRLALEAVVKAEGIAPSEDEIEEEYKTMAESYKIDLEKIKETVPLGGVVKDIAIRKAVELIKSNAVPDGAAGEQLN